MEAYPNISCYDMHYGKIIYLLTQQAFSIVKIIHLCCASSDFVKVFVSIIINALCLRNKSKFIYVNNIKTNWQGNNHKWF